ncbi:MAG TPA: Gfo/Idh/MocA family oxidoreductase [Mycobacteriales bacterium]|nr:Gfo/Idh/MocA family oxidoreductase [Mycobacteriales bacterium]
MTPPTGRPIRLGIVGCARILPAHLRGIARLQAVGLDPVRITALCARRIEDAVMFRRRGEGPPARPPASDNPQDALGAPHRYVSDLHPDVLPAVFDDWRAMLDADVVDAVLVLAPVGLHHQIALAAIAAGKHVLLEKPLAISVRAGHAIANAAASRGLVAGVAENVRYTTRTRALRWVLDQGLVGTPQLWLSGGVGGEWAPDRIVAHTAWRHRKLDGGGGPALDHGVHLMHQIRYLMGPIEEISALTRTLEPVRRGGDGLAVVNQLEDLYLAQFRFASGALGSTFSSWGGHGERSGLDASPIIYGAAGSIRGDAVAGDEGPIGNATDLLASQAPAALRERLFPAGLDDAFGLELLDFTRAIAAGSAMEASAAEGVLDLAMAYAILESSFAGGPVRVADVLDGSVAGYQTEIDEHYHL